MGDTTGLGLKVLNPFKGDVHETPGEFQARSALTKGSRVGWRLAEAVRCVGPSRIPKSISLCLF